MAKKKEKVVFLEDVQIADKSAAQKLYEKENKWFIFKLICTVISLLGTIIMVTDSVGKSDIFGYVVILGIIACILAAGPFIVIKTCWNFVKLGWYLVPVFPIDICVALCAGVLGLVILLYAPVVYCLFGLAKSYKNKKQAEQYLAMSGN